MPNHVSAIYKVAHNPDRYEGIVVVCGRSFSIRFQCTISSSSGAQANEDTNIKRKNAWFDCDEALKQVLNPYEGMLLARLRQTTCTPDSFAKDVCFVAEQGLKNYEHVLEAKYSLGELLERRVPSGDGHGTLGVKRPNLFRSLFEPIHRPSQPMARDIEETLQKHTLTAEYHEALHTVLKVLSESSFQQGDNYNFNMPGCTSKIEVCYVDPKCARHMTFKVCDVRNRDHLVNIDLPILPDEIVRQLSKLIEIEQQTDSASQHHNDCDTHAYLNHPMYDIFSKLSLTPFLEENATSGTNHLDQNKKLFMDLGNWVFDVKARYAIPLTLPSSRLMKDTMDSLNYLLNDFKEEQDDPYFLAVVALRRYGHLRTDKELWADRGSLNKTNQRANSLLLKKKALDDVLFYARLWSRKLTLQQCGNPFASLLLAIISIVCSKCVSDSKSFVTPHTLLWDALSMIDSRFNVIEPPVQDDCNYNTSNAKILGTNLYDFVTSRVIPSRLIRMAKVTFLSKAVEAGMSSATSEDTDSHSSELEHDEHKRVKIDDTTQHLDVRVHFDAESLQKLNLGSEYTPGHLPYPPKFHIVGPYSNLLQTQLRGIVLQHWHSAASVSANVSAILSIFVHRMQGEDEDDEENGSSETNSSIKADNYGERIETRYATVEASDNII